MAEKEEITQNNRIINAEKDKRRIKKGRIYIDVRDKKLNCLLSKVYTRQEAIKRIAKEIARQYDPRKPNKEEYERIWKNELFPATKKYYLEQGESVLNALLEGK